MIQKDGILDQHADGYAASYFTSSSESLTSFLTEGQYSLTKSPYGFALSGMVISSVGYIPSRMSCAVTGFTPAFAPTH